jgi:hypothetical protein
MVLRSIRTTKARKGEILQDHHIPPLPCMGEAADVHGVEGMNV